MKVSILCLFYIPCIFVYGQNRKEQIDVLTSRADSIQTVLNYNRSTHKREILDMQSTASDLLSNIRDLNMLIEDLKSTEAKLNAQIATLNTDTKERGLELSTIQAILLQKSDSLRLYRPEIKSIIIGSKIREVVAIGSMVWMVKNLDVDIFNDGYTIREAQDPKQWDGANQDKAPAWCYLNGDPENGVKYGKLYNWYAVSSPHGLCPAGWHVPSDADWEALAMLLGGEQIAGSKLKATSGWTDFGKTSRNGNNQSGFTGLPGSNRFEDGSSPYTDDYLEGACSTGFWWSTDEVATDNASGWFLNCNDGGLKRQDFPKGGGFSVRCLRD